MLQHEFESLTGLKINESQYEVINGMYSCSNNQTKQDFCKMFMAMELMNHVDYVVNLKVDKMELSRNCRKAEEDAKDQERQVLRWTNKYQALEGMMKATGEALAVIASKLTEGGAE